MPSTTPRWMSLIATIAIGVGIGSVGLRLEASEKPAAEQAPDMPLDKSVEQLAETARKSVVVISVSGRDGKQQGIGSGFIISEDGLIATNAHVIGEGRPISVQFNDGKQVPVTSIHATQRAADLAIIKVDLKNLPVLELGDASTLKQGQGVVAIGNPHGLKHSIVSGVVSGTREIEGRNMIQLAMPIEPGNSGGPLLDLQGRVRGIITMKSLVTNNLGFAVMVNALKPLLDKPNPVSMDRWLTIGTLDSKEWTPLFGARWRQRSGRITVDGLGSGFGGRSLCLSELPVPEIPYEIQTQVKLGDESGAAGLVFHSDGGDLHYGFYPSAGKLKISRFDGPDVFSWNVIQEKPSPAYRKGEWNLLKVRVEKDRMICFVNDEKVFESTDTRLTGGKFGLAKFRETTAEFKGFKAGKDLPRITPDPAEADVIRKLVADISPTGGLAPKVVQELVPRGDTAVSVLRQQARRLELQALQLKRLANVVHEQRGRSELVQLMQRKEDEIDLFRAVLLIAWMDNDELDMNSSLQQLERLSRQLTELIPKDATPEVKRVALNKFLFEDNGFHGSRGDYYNKSNSYINEVLDDREGLPITLSVLYLELARRIGLDVVGIGLPSHFVVEQLPPTEPRQFIDVFEAGKILTRVDAEELVKKNTDRPLQETELGAVTKKKIVSRIVQNLLGLARDSEDAPAMLRYIETLVELDPTAAPQRWLRAVFRFELGMLDEALIDTNWLLQTSPEGVDLSRVKELQQLIERRQHEGN
ncbi:MAG: peptidase and chymotrypsin/Hap [Planctomycetaceae bacterium]|nr:peptidase and chymotrypsin/Hap [Planctomycetaceae bacterium]